MASINYLIQDVEKVVKFDEKVKNVKINRLIGPGENYLSLVLQVDFEVEKNGHSRIISSVAKCLPPKTKQEMMHIRGHIMRNEIRWYSEIIPLLKDFAQEYDIKIDIYPEYHGSRYSLNSSKQEVDVDSVLLLENLISKGYQNDDRYIGCDLNTSKAVLKSLALFHAIPIAMKVKKPKSFQILKDYLDSTRPNYSGGNGPPDSKGDRVSPGSPTSDGPRSSPGSSNESQSSLEPNKERRPFDPLPGEQRPEEVLFEELSKIPDFAPYISKIKPLLEKPPMGPDVIEKKTKEPWNTITHSDFWVNNIMVNYTKENPQIKIVDFQMCSYGTYAKDLVFFLLLSVRNDVTREHLDDLFRFYYEEFTSILRKTHTNLELTFEDFMNEVNGAAVDSQVACALQFATITFGEKGTGVDIAVEEFVPIKHLTAMIRKMNQYHKDKLLLIASEAVRRNWV